MIRTPKVLLLISDEAERREVEAILDPHALTVHARNIPEMKSYLQNDAVDVLFCAWPFYRTNWRGVLDEVWNQYPDLPVIVLSPNGGEREWIEVLDSGAFDLLAWPLLGPTVLAVVEQATASYEARREHGFVAPGLATEVAR